VGADLYADSTVDLAGRTVHVGSEIVVRDPRTGRSARLRVAGLVDRARYRGIEHVYVSRTLVDSLGGGPAASNLLYVQTSAGTNPGVLAAIIDGTHLQNGTVARPFSTLASDALSSQRQFVEILEAFAAVGLIAVLTGIAALMIDRVRERRRQIAILRAIGFRARTIRRSVRIETALIALEGTIAGVLPGLLLAWRLQATGALGRPLPLALPWLVVAAIVVAVVAVSLLAATAAARRAGKIPPATSVRAT
jgi:putative ABC transport system permease protein